MLWPRFDLLIAQDGANPAMHDVGELVLEMMSMHGRGQRARSEEMLHQGEAAASVLPIDHEPIADPIGVPNGRALAREKNPSALLRTIFGHGCPSITE